MLDANEFQIATVLRNYMLANWVTDSEWYVGITNDIERRLFDKHKVDETNGKYSIVNAGTLASADKIERYLLKTYSNLKEHHGLGANDSTFVYI